MKSLLNFLLLVQSKLQQKKNRVPRVLKVHVVITFWNISCLECGKSYDTTLLDGSPGQYLRNVGDSLQEKRDDHRQDRDPEDKFL